MTSDDDSMTATLSQAYRMVSLPAKEIFILLRILSELLSNVIQLSRDKTFPSILLLLSLQKEKKEETEEKIRFQSEVCQQT